MVLVPVPTFEKVKVQVPVPVPTCEKLWFRFQRLDNKILEIYLPFYILSCFTRKKYINFNKLSNLV
jgi:hypothetical protein